jgi:glycosyltransferase involved in cell wall biosynthesis
MQRYPVVIFFRYDAYKDVDAVLETNKENLNCDVRIVSSRDDLVKLFDPNFSILVTYGPIDNEYNHDVNVVVPHRMFTRWLHFSKINVEEFSRGVNYCFIHNVVGNRESTRPTFSAFTTCYNSYEKIKRPLTSLMQQTMADWEWVVLDDSPDDKHFEFLRGLFAGNPKIRLYRRSENSGNIGNVKNEAASLCRGKYVLELDHDDEIVEDLFANATSAFNKHPDVGFVYTDFTNLYENGGNTRYGDFIGLGYGGYYCERFRGRWVYVYVTPQINNITLSHLVSLPNHARIWRRETLFEIGNYSEFLPINDDQEILMRTAIKTKMAKIPGIGYVQYMNENNSNFSLIRNSEINRIGPIFLRPQFYEVNKVEEYMKQQDAYDESFYMWNNERIWLRESFVPRYCSKIYQPKCDTQYCIVGTDTFVEKIDEITELYKNPRNDFFLIDASGNNEALWKFLDERGFERMKSYTIEGLTKEQMVNYFNFIYKTAENGIVL